mgnify:CR=1 FL=1
MFSKSNLLATLVATIVIFTLNIFLASIPPFQEFTKSHEIFPDGFVKEEPNFLLMLLTPISWAFFLSTIYGMFKNEVHNFWKGFKFGFLFGLLVKFSTSLGDYSMFNKYDLTFTLTSGLLDIIVSGVVCGMIALIYKSNS